MRITYVARSLLDYRIPVLYHLKQKLNDNFNFIYSADYIPKRVHNKVKDILGKNAIGLTGEKRIGQNRNLGLANSMVRIVYQPGLISAIAKTKPTVLVGDGFFQWTGFALVYKIFKTTPLVVCYERTFHTERNVQWYRRVYRRFVLRFIDAMTCNGRLCSEYVQWLGMPEANITTGHMVADTENLERAVLSISASARKAQREALNCDGLVFIAVGKLTKRKGIKELLLGWSLLEKIYPDNFKLVLVGDGPEEDSLKSLAQDLGLNSVLFTGHIDYDEITKYYAAADVFVMPTLEDNWSLVVPEAMSCGLPVLCSKYNGCYPELIASGENGWIFDPLSIRDTFEALRKCVENKSSLQQMGQKSKEIVLHHTPQHAAQAIFNACEIAIQRTNPK